MEKIVRIDEDRIITNKHNNPPSEIEQVGLEILQKYPEYFSRAQQILKQADELVPSEISDEETSKKVGDFLKQMKSLHSELNGCRESEKQPYLAKERAIEGFFQKYMEPLKSKMKEIAPIQAKWVEAKKAAAERKRIEEQERKRIEAEKKLAEAEEAERKAKQEREEAQRKAEQQAREADAERKRIEEEAAEKKRIQDEELRKLREEEEAAAKARQDEIDRLKKEKEDRENADREQKRKDREAIEKAERDAREADRIAKQKIKDEEEKTKQIERDKKEQEKAIKEKERLAEEEKKEAERAAKFQEREAAHNFKQAEKLEAQANRMDKIDAVDGRVRGEQGSLSTTRVDWTGHIVDREVLDYGPLLPHIKTEALNDALKSYVKAGGRQLRGAAIYEDTKLQVR